MEQRVALDNTDIRAYRTYAEGADLDIDALEQTSRGTIKSDADEAFSQLPDLRPVAMDGPTAALRLGETLGEGGIGRVLVAEQVELVREVAVKLLHPQVRSAKARQLLVTEAIVTGCLEHPNIPPIHSLGVDEDGRPVIVMKRIEGVRWTEIILDPGSHTSKIGPRSALDFHLDVLLEVCRAMFFAHSKGIIHRDIKPDNVMVGLYGDIYVVDWGIAVQASRNPKLPVPMASSVTKVEGTPDFMAPEMARGDGASIDRRTDVYLLGATLHFLLTKRGRHDGDNVVDMLAHAFHSPPYEYADSVPGELAAIANLACSADPGGRFPGVRAFQWAIEAYRTHEKSRYLCSVGRDLEKSVEASLTGKHSLAPDLHRIANEARFAYAQALRAWPENGDAQKRLSALVRRLVDFELAVGNPGAALAHLADLPRPDPELEAKVEEARQRRAEQTQIITLTSGRVVVGRWYSWAGIGMGLMQALTFAIGMVVGLDLGPGLLGVFGGLAVSLLGGASLFGQRRL